MKFTSILCFTILLIGGINCLSIGFLSFDFLTALFGIGTVATKTVYAVIGLSALWVIFFIFVYKPFKHVAN